MEIRKLQLVKLSEVKASILKNDEVQCGSFRLGFDDGVYYVGRLFLSQRYVEVETIAELKEWLSSNKNLCKIINKR